MRKLIIDCDPGIDDAFAIASAYLDPEFEILAIHTVAGNVDIENTTHNARALAHVLGYKGSINRGAKAPLIYEPFSAAEVHGNNGFGGYQLTELAPLSEESAFDSARRILLENDKITYVALGPLTNLAILIKAHPELIHKIEVISLMGGGIKGGNTTLAGEFNFYADPHAAHIVFESGIPLIMAGLDVTEKAYITTEDINEIKTNGRQLGELLYEISKVSFKFSKEILGHERVHLHDVMSVLALSHPDLFETKDFHMRISTDDNFMRGMSMADRRPRSQEKPNVTVLTEIDRDKFRQLLLTRFTIGGH